MASRVALAVALIASTSAHAQDYKTAEIDKIFSWVKPGMPGCVAAASRDGKLMVNRAYGLADLERDVPLTAESLLDAGSIRKQFVAAAILTLVEEGKLSLSDDVRKHIPELHDFGHTIYADNPDIVIRNRALAYEPQGGGAWIMDMRLGEERGGAGALFTTAADLVLWNDALHGGRLGRFVTEKIQEPAILANGRKLTYAPGLSLLTEKGTRIVVHGGGAAAYRAFAASDDRDDFAGHIFDLSNDRFEIKSMEGATVRYRRAQPYAPTADDLKDDALRSRPGGDGHRDGLPQSDVSQSPVHEGP